MFTPKFRKIATLLTFAVLVCVVSFLAFRFPSGQNLNRIWSDARTYYVYLPALFIYGFQDLPALEAGPYDEYPGARGVFTRSTYGVALLESPFFLTTHFITSHQWFKSSAPNGFSPSYSDALVVSAVFYALLGLFILFAALRRYFSAGVSFLAVVSVFLGSSLFYYTVAESGMAHVYGFFMAVLLLWQTPRVYEKPTWLRFGALGFIAGFLVLIRPTNILLLLYPLFYEVYSGKDLLLRFRFALEHLSKVLVAGVFFWVAWLPQMIYWKYITNHWWVYSYGTAQFIFWQHPKLLRVLFDVQNGLLIYSPVLWFSMVGLVVFSWRNQLSTNIIAIILTLAWYAFGSWVAWWFGGAFGYRSIIEYLPFLSIPMAGIYSLLPQTKVPWRWIGYGLIALCIYYSVHLSYLYVAPWDGDSWNWDTFGKILKKVFPWGGL